LISSSGAATLIGNIVLTSDASFGGAGNLTLSGSVDGALNDSESLTLTGSGTTTFNGIIGGIDELKSLSQGNTAGTVEFDQTVNLGDGGAILDANVNLGGIQFLSAGSITFGTSAVDTLNITNQATTIQSANGSITLDSTTNALQSLFVTTQGTASVLAVNSAMTGGASISLTSANVITISATVVTTGAGSIAVTGDNRIAINTRGAIETHNKQIQLTSDAMQLGGAVNAGAGTIELQQFTAGTKINLGGLDDPTGSPRTLGLSASDLTNVTAGQLDIGNSSTGIVSDVECTDSPSDDGQQHRRDVWRIDGDRSRDLCGGQCQSDKFRQQRRNAGD
jgi:hypothetical protein